MKPIPYGRQQISEDDIKAVVSILRSDFLTQGPTINEFEKAFAAYVGSEYAVAVANGTAALHLGALSLNLKPGQKVITTSISFAASSNCVCFCGAKPVFADIDPKSYLIDLQRVRGLLHSSPYGTYAGIIPVDFSGAAVNTEILRQMADEFGLWILEDACHAPGGYFTDRNGIQQRCGNGRFADLTVFSFHPVKHLTCGEGGMITTNNRSLYEKLLLLRAHGITRDPEKVDGNKGGWYYEMQELGFNYRLTDFQAALGISQLKRADEGLKRRRAIAREYFQAFSEAPWIKNQSGIVDGHAYHLYIIEVGQRRQLYDYLRSQGIHSQVHYIPIHTMPYYQRLGWKKGDLPNAENYYNGCLSLPMFPSLTDEEVDFTIKTILNFSKI